MKKIKLLSVTALICILVLFSVLEANCVSTVDCTMDIPSQIMVNKTVTAQMNISCADKKLLGAGVITVVYDQNALIFKSCQLNYKDSTQINYTVESGELKIVYWCDHNGINTNIGGKNFISVKFEACGAEQKTDLTVYSADNVSFDETRLNASDGMQYTVALTTKEVTSAQNASGTRVAVNANSSKSSKAEKNNTSSKSKSSSKNSSASSSKSSKNTTTKTSSEKAHNNNVIDDLFGEDSTTGANSNLKYFIVGGGFAISLVAIILLAYKLGKRKATDKNTANNVADETTEEKIAENLKKNHNDTVVISAETSEEKKNNAEKRIDK